MIKVTTVSEDFFNQHQSWNHVSVMRVANKPVRVEIRANAYEAQSHATISVWSADGWKFHTDLPTDQWYDWAPKYVKTSLSDDDRDHFRNVRHVLVSRYTDAMLNDGDIEVS